MEEVKKKKKAYVKPEMHVEEFTPNEYIAACTGENKWLIKCNVEKGVGFIDTNGNGNFDYGTDQYIVDGTGCGTEHTVTLPTGQEPTANAMWENGYFEEKWTGGLFGKWKKVWVSTGTAFPAVWFQQDVPEANNNHFSIATKGEWRKNHS